MTNQYPRSGFSVGTRPGEGIIIEAVTDAPGEIDYPPVFILQPQEAIDLANAILAAVHRGETNAVCSIG